MGLLKMIFAPKPRQAARRAPTPPKPSHSHTHQHNPPDEQAVIAAVIERTVSGKMQWVWFSGPYLQAEYNGRRMNYQSQTRRLEIYMPDTRNLPVPIPRHQAKLFHETVLNLGTKREIADRAEVYKHFTS